MFHVLGDHLEVNGGEALLATTPAGDKQMEGLTPEPKPQRNEAEEEKRQADIKALNKKINGRWSQTPGMLACNNLIVSLQAPYHVI